jgi:hypothetical protein
MKKIKCSICKETIMPDYNGWDGGHNAEPINSGICCGSCNTRVVTPTRIMLYVKDKEKREVTNDQKEESK